MKLRLATLIVSVSLSLVALGEIHDSVSASCANFLAIDGVLYSRSQMNDEANLGRMLTVDDIGPVYRRVAANRESLPANPGGAGTPVPASCGPRDNFSTDLPLGTPLHEVQGYDPAFRLAAVPGEGRIVLFEATYVPSARHGRQLFDIGGRVVAIRLVDRDTREATMIEDPEVVSRLVEVMLAAPIGSPDVPNSDERPLIVVYHLADGTATQDFWYQSSGKLSSGIRAPAEFSDLLRTALRGAHPRAATPTA